MASYPLSYPPVRWLPSGVPVPVTVTHQLDPATQATLEGIRADAAIAAAAARAAAAQAPSAAQSAATASQGIAQVGQAAPGIAQGANRIGEGIQSTSGSIAQVGKGLGSAGGALLQAQQRAEHFAKLAAFTVFAGGLAVAFAAVIFAPQPNKANGRRRGRR